MTTLARQPRNGSLLVFSAVLVVAILGRPIITEAVSAPSVRIMATVFVAVCVQALPFLVLGALLSGLIAAFVTPAVLRRLLPASPAAAVPIAAVAGIAVPGCECAGAPVARRLMGQGVPDAAALAFLLAAPAVNPVVLVATAVAFPTEPRMVVARFVGSVATACVTGWIWQRFGRPGWITGRLGPATTPADSRWWTQLETARHDLVASGGFLVLGAAAAAAVSVLVPPSWTETLAGRPVQAVLTLAVLAVVLALCSQADAFVIASVSTLPLLPRLVFLVVGPAVDLKLVALQIGTFGRGFATRFAPLTFVVALGCAVLAGLVLL